MESVPPINRILKFPSNIGADGAVKTNIHTWNIPK
jgi:hypothetical protein